jgi:hypothetical protein
VNPVYQCAEVAPLIRRTVHTLSLFVGCFHLTAY